MSTSAHRFFFNGDLVSELVEDDFEDSDRLAIALTCRATSDIALARLWRHVDRLSHLVNILAPLVPVDPTSDPPMLAFRRAPRAEDWIRFRIYARRVRTLRFEDNPHEEAAVRAFGLISPNIFDQLACNISEGPLLPNLWRLEWNASAIFMPYCTMFMHSELREIRIGYSALEGASFPAASDIIQEIVARVPNIERLFVNAIFGHRHLVEEILTVLPKLPQLTALALPRLWITSEAVSQFKAVAVRGEEMEVIPYPSSYDHVGDVGNVRDFISQLDNNYIPGLQRLIVDATLDDIFYLIDSPDRPQHLQSLSIHTPHLESPTMIHDFLILCARNLPELKSLHLTLVPPYLEHNGLDFPYNHGSPFITAHTLFPLHHFRNLRDFKLDNLTPIDISEDELFALIQDWEHLESLSLNPQPILEPFPSQLTLGALIPFMTHCPNLTSLALWVDATRLPTLPFYPPTPPIRFPPLFKTLDLGSSKINQVDITLVGNYLAYYFPSYTPRYTLSETADLTEEYVPNLRVWNRYPQLVWPDDQLDRAGMWHFISLNLPMMVSRRDSARAEG